MSGAGAEGERLVALTRELAASAERHGAPLNAIGGVGVLLRAGAPDPRLRRTYGDLDLVGASADRRRLDAALRESGLEEHRSFNAARGHRRQIWWLPDGDLHVDVFLDRFEMCHDLDLRGRLRADEPALEAADLLLTKLQVVELNDKDVVDAAALLVGPARVETERLVDVLCADWGFHTTFTDNLAGVSSLAVGRWPDLGPPIAERCETILAALEDAPKTRGFRVRGRVGRRKRWYRLPEESVEAEA